MFEKDVIAETLHEAGRAYLRALGDDYLPAWHDAPRWMQEAMLELVDYLIDNPVAPAHAAHDYWRQGMLARGWRVGEARDWLVRRDPNMVPWDELSEVGRRRAVLLHNVFFALVVAEV